MRLKSCPALIKAAGESDGLGAGQFTAYASVFGNTDSYGDIVQKGAFADTLAEWDASGDPIPLYWSHLMGADPEFNIGEVLTAAEDDTGLLVTAQLDIEENPKAAAVYRLLKGRRVKQMSFAFDILKAEPNPDTDGLLLQQLKLHEVSVVPIGANQETDVLAVKAGAADLLGGLKAGRVISAKNLESLKSARDSIDAVIKAAEADDQEKASGHRPAKNEGPTGVKTGRVKFEEPSAAPSAADLATQLAFLTARGAAQ